MFEYLRERKEASFKDLEASILGVAQRSNERANKHFLLFMVMFYYSLPSNANKKTESHALVLGFR